MSPWNCLVDEELRGAVQGDLRFKNLLEVARVKHDAFRKQIGKKDILHKALSR